MRPGGMGAHLSQHSWAPCYSNPLKKQRSQLCWVTVTQWHLITHAQAERVSLWGKNTDQTAQGSKEVQTEQCAAKKAGTSSGMSLCQNLSTKDGTGSQPPFDDVVKLQLLKDYRCTLAILRVTAGSNSWVLSTLPNCKYPPHVKLTWFILHLYYAILAPKKGQGSDIFYIEYYFIPYNEEHN